jgi:hypothetical protein
MQIGVTEPRRIAAISVAARVAHELNLSGRQVSYQVSPRRAASSDPAGPLPYHMWRTRGLSRFATSRRPPASR